ncbi:deubiquitinase DESI2-like [Convolutriloba macropyga]|uniref:deubiquitinase DESI2-like n=1 Tax=Convolutriloba macropyga TaxID=536237 RepID=UPI003F5239BF
MNIFRRCTNSISSDEQGAIEPHEDSNTSYAILGEGDNFPVYLNVYDLNRLNSYTGPVGFGVYHTGVEVHGTEYSFGGHPYPISGIFEMDPRSAADLGQNFNYKETVLLGQTFLDLESVHEIVQQLGEDFKGYTYHLVHKNCNHFSMAFSRILCGAEIPNWVNRLASLTACLPFIQRCIPAEWLTPVALQESLRNNEDVHSSTGGDGDHGPDSEPSLTATTHHNNSIQVYDSIPTSGHETSDSTGAPGGRGGAGNARSTASAATESAVEFLGRLTGANTHPNNAPRRPSLT